MKVLVVEDYSPIRKAVEATLRESGYAVDCAIDGAEGYSAASNGGYDCIVLDWMLPKMTGIEVLTRLRQVADQTPILMPTAKDATEDRIKGLDFGADDYLVKPFAIGELLARIRALIRRHYSAKNPIIIIGNLSLDTIAKRLKRNEQWIELSAMEYSLLEYLALRGGQVVSRSDIWNFAGLLPIWDILFGTYYMPIDRWRENFGMFEPMPKGYIGRPCHRYSAARKNQTPTSSTTPPQWTISSGCFEF